MGGNWDGQLGEMVGGLVEGREKEGGAVVAWRSRNMVITVTNRVPFGRSATKSVNSEQMSPTLVGNWSLIKTRK